MGGKRPLLALYKENTLEHFCTLKIDPALIHVPPARRPVVTVNLTGPQDAQISG